MLQTSDAFVVFAVRVSCAQTKRQAYSVILLLALIASGAVLALDIGYLKSTRSAGVAAGSIREPAIVGYARSFFPVILIVLIVRSFLFEPFRITSASMMPSLVDGDFIFVNKFSYGLRLPVFNNKVLSTGVPRRGDVIVFRLPSDPSVHYIKRLIGLPGNHVVVHNNRVPSTGWRRRWRQTALF